MSNGSALANKTDLPEAVARRGITEAEWRTLCNSLYPGANPNSVLMVIDYCRARKLDPLKKPCHIVPMEVKDAKTNKYEWRDVILPGVYELRVTAQRTGLYLGHTKAEYGELIDFNGKKVPASCAMTMYRWNVEAQQRIEFPVSCDFVEVVALNKDGRPNARWARAPKQMLTKCTEAAGLRETFPDELGGQQTSEELEGQRAIDITGTAVSAEPAPPTQTLPPMPGDFEEWLIDLSATADEGWPAFEAAWAASAVECRNYLAATDPGKFETLKAKAEAVGQ